MLFYLSLNTKAEAFQKSDCHESHIFSTAEETGKCLKPFPHCSLANRDRVMATTYICVFTIFFCVTLAEDVNLKYKATSKPVRLFTEEDLKRYDGSEVNFGTNVVQSRCCLNEGERAVSGIIIGSTLNKTRLLLISLACLGGTAHLHGH